MPLVAQKVVLRDYNLDTRGAHSCWVGHWFFISSVGICFFFVVEIKYIMTSYLYCQFQVMTWFLFNFPVMHLYLLVMTHPKISVLCDTSLIRHFIFPIQNTKTSQKATLILMPTTRLLRIVAGFFPPSSSCP